jgi:hypothetical protein
LTNDAVVANELVIALDEEIANDADVANEELIEVVANELLNALMMQKKLFLIMIL